SSVKELIELLENFDLESHAIFSALSGRILNKLEAALLRISNETHKEAVYVLHDEYKNNLDKIVSIILPHSKVESKNNLILHILDQIRPTNVEQALDKSIHRF
ncbi:18645_t:CDS:2, partial [Funneliformis geosporum]